MTFLISLLTGFRASRLFGPVMWALGAVAVFLAVFFAGSAWNDRGQEIEKLQNDIETGDRIDETNIPIDDAGVLERLCELAGLGKRCGQENGG
jgi:HAMP domain-containing protein